MLKKTIITPQFGPEKGGIQAWAYYIDKIFTEHYGKGATVVALREMRLKSYFDLLKINLLPHNHFLMTWKMSVAVFLSMFLDLFRKRQAHYFVFVHGNEILNLSATQKRWIDQLIKSPRFSFIANSIAISEIFATNFNRSVDIVIPPFVDIQKLFKHSKTAKKEPMANGEILFFSLSRLVKRKNIHNVLYALNQLKQEGLAFKYMVGGIGPEMKKLKTLTHKLGIEKEVKFLGKITEDEKMNILSKCNFFLLPSIFDIEDGSIEGYGIVYIEANAFSVPVISGNTGGIPEAVVNGKTGLTSDGSVNDIQNKIENLITLGFSTETFRNHALKHDYRNQPKFIEFINSFSK